MQTKIAKIISAVFEPYTVASVTLLLIILRLSQTNSEKFSWLIIAFVFGALPPISILFYEKKTGKIKDWFMSNRDERRDVQLAWVFGSAVVTSLTLIFALPRAIQAVSLTFFTLSLVITVINFYWKISVHTAMITLAVFSLVLIYSSSLAALVILILLVAWARVKLAAHTWSQVSAGALLTLIIAYFWFNLFGLATF